MKFLLLISILNFFFDINFSSFWEFQKTNYLDLYKAIDVKNYLIIRIFYSYKTSHLECNFIIRFLEFHKLIADLLN